MADTDELVNQVMGKLLNKANAGTTVDTKPTQSGLTEFVGTAPVGDTIGMVIANVDSGLSENLHLQKQFRSLGILSARTGGGPQIMSMDEAVKATNTQVVSIQMPRDTKGGAGHGSLIIVGGDDVSDVRRAIEVALAAVPTHFGDVYNSPAGHLELQYTARASEAAHFAFNAPIGKAYGLIAGAPAGIGVVMGDTALKAANVDVLSFASPAYGTSFSNEGILHISGDSGAVRQAVVAAREVGLDLLGTLAGKPKNDFPSYI
ncbi:Propanediol utilization polyhedral body protein PduB [Furfurilactobacillus rossiae]|uniref:propanediol utilization microcompartment protein PduB n=1 Tax=Furfurilactobacillus rossiae TaxID=231049 RepID=UPI001CDB6A3F|nr:propanediol utilization microcompartment protein PduB [Furfurilactobacillus rossiae]MCF6166642.1 propanediol utilization microcompartment protein PduB [Furfurilactobacillus rossiae]QLE64391.1 Propanediol utilization polyhedral body protein PduB [Furfurilactobacillus rossiae]